MSMPTLDQKIDNLTGAVERIEKIVPIVVDLQVKVDRLVPAVDSLQKTVDRLVPAVVSLQIGHGEIVARLTHLEEQHARTFDKIDGFLVLLQRHEAELASLRSAYDRLDERVRILEAA